MEEIRIYMRYEKREINPAYAFLEALGFDKNQDIFAKILEELKKKPQSSLELSKRVNLSRSTVIYYLDILLKRGIICHYNKKFYLAGNAFSQVIQVIEMETTKSIMQLKKIAKELDEKTK